MRVIHRARAAVAPADKERARPSCVTRAVVRKPLDQVRYEDGDHFLEGFETARSSEGVLDAEALGRAARHDRLHVEARREARQSRGAQTRRLEQRGGQLAQRSVQRAGRDRAEIADGGEAERVEHASGGAAHAWQDAHVERRQKGTRFRLWESGESIRLVQSTAELSEEFRGGDADRGGQAALRADCRLAAHRHVTRGAQKPCLLVVLGRRRLRSRCNANLIRST